MNSRSITSKGSGNCNTEINLGASAVASTATNYLMIVVTTTDTSERTYGGIVTIAAT